jgi:hypothetical protein
MSNANDAIANLIRTGSKSAASGGVSQDPIAQMILGGRQPRSNLRTPSLDELATGESPETTPLRSLEEQTADTYGPGIPLAPPFIDLTQIPRSPFTNQIEPAPAMATQEEIAKNGVIQAPPKATMMGPRGIPVQIPADTGQGFVRAIAAGAPEGSEISNLKQSLTGMTSEEIARQARGGLRLFDPSELMSETERAQHPIVTGAGEFAGGMTSPENLALIGLTAGAGEFIGPGQEAVQRMLAAGFSIPMLIGAARQAPEVSAAFRRGDTATAERLLTRMVLGAGLAGLAGRGMFEEEPSPFVPAGSMPGIPTEEGVPTEPSGIAETGGPPTRAELIAAGRMRPSPEAETVPTRADLVAAGRMRPAPKPIVGAGERTIAEPKPTLDGQVEALRNDTNPAVYFPKGTENLPEPPDNAQVTVVPGNKPGAGTYYHGPDISPEQIHAAVEDGSYGKLLGYTQSKEEANAGTPAVVAARDASGTELKAAITDVSDPHAVAQQAAVLARQFPDAEIGVETPQQAIAARLGATPTPEENASQRPLSGQTTRLSNAPAPVRTIPKYAYRLRDVGEEGLPISSGSHAQATVSEQEARSYMESRGKATGNPQELVRINLRSLDPSSFELKPGPNGNPWVKFTRPLPEDAIERVQEPPDAVADLIRGKSAPQENLRIRQNPQALNARFSPETLEEARQELRSAHELASSFEQPGRYFAEYGDQSEYMPSRSTNAAKGIHAGGTWYGVSSSRHIVAEQFPWYGEIEQGPVRLGKLIEKGKGAEYNRLLSTVAESIEREKASAAPIMAEYAPKLRALSNRINGNDVELSRTLAQLAENSGRGFKNLRNYIEGKITDAEEASKFYELIDTAADEARETSVAESPESRGELRPGEGRLTGLEETPAERDRAAARISPAESATPAEPAETPESSYRLTAQRERAGRPTEEENTFPGMENAVEEQRTGAARVQGERLGEEANRPLGSIEQAAGEMERTSPLFRGHGPQNELFGTEARDELLGPNEGNELGTRYSGLSPAAIKELLPERVREKLETEVRANRRARNLQGQLYDLESQNAADLVRSRNVLREAPGTAADMEAIYHHLEDPSIRLTADQQKILDGYLRPILDESERINEKLEGGQVENYVHRIPVGKGSLLDRIMGGESKLSAGRGLSKSAASLKGRTMMALEDEAGNRRVVSIKDGKVTAFDQGQAEDLGRIRGLETQGIKTRGAVLDRETEPMRQELAKLETERRTLTATKGRAESARRRIENIDNREAELREGLQDAYRTDEGKLLSENDLRGRVFVDKNGKQWKITQATTKEIEANTNVRYYKNALASTVLNFLNLRRAERSYDFLEAYKASPDFRDAAVKINGNRVPAGYRTTDLPQFHGYAFEPHTSEVLDWYSKRLRAGDPSVYRQIGNFLRTAIFFNPLIHTPNIGVHWIVEKGLTGFGPQNWGTILRSGSRAIDAVIHQNGDFLDALDAGAPLQSARLDNALTTKLFIERMGRELEANPTAAQKVARALGYANPLKLVHAIYDFSSRVTWVSNDIAVLQATYQHMERTGQSFKEAVTDVSKHIPDYRLPTRIFDSPAVAKVMSNPALTMFGAYHYGALRSYGEMAKGLVSEDLPPAERFKALDRLAMLGLVTFVVYPQLDKLAKLLTGDQSAQFRRAGASTFVWNLVQLAKGERSPTQVLESVATPAIHTQAFLQLALNRNFFTGRRIVDWNADAKTIAAQLARYGGQQLSPVNLGMQVTSGRRTLGQQIAGLAGIKTNVPTPAEALARKFAAESAGTSAPAQDTLERAYLRTQYENDLRNRKMTLQDLGHALMAHTITSEDAKIIVQRAVNTPLQNHFKALPIEQALRVWDKANPQEQAPLRQMLIEKVQKVNPNRFTPEQRENLKAQIIAALSGKKAAAAPSFAGIPLMPPEQETQPKQTQTPFAGIPLAPPQMGAQQ